MTRLKTGAELLLCAMLIVALALLPQAVSTVTDRMEMEKPITAPVQTIELTVDTAPRGESNESFAPGYMLRRLALEQNMTTIPILPESASMTQEEALNAAQTAMEIYVGNRVFEWFSPTYSQAQPYLGVDPENMNNSAVFWGVTFSYEKKDDYHSLFLHIDDETGKPIYIKYEIYGKNGYPFYYPDKQHLAMEGLISAFLAPLGLEGLGPGEYENLLDIGVTAEQLSDGYTCTQYTFVDAQYGKILVEFHINPSGFYVHFPK